MGKAMQVSLTHYTFKLFVQSHYEVLMKGIRKVFVLNKKICYIAAFCSSKAINTSRKLRL